MVKAERRKIPEVALTRGSHRSLVRQPRLGMKCEREVSKLDANGFWISLDNLFDDIHRRPAHRALQVGKEF